MHKTSPLLEQFAGVEQPQSLATLLFLLVVSLHLWAVQRLAQPQQPLVLAQPLMMQVSMVSAPKPQAQLAPPAPPAPPKPPEPIKPKPKQIPVKKPVKHKPKLPKPVKLPKAVTPIPLPEPADEAQTEEATVSQHVVVNPNPAAVSNPKPPVESYSEATFNANYGSNPKPKYPASARSRGWQGKVLLRVKVTAEGFSESVTVERSSGHEILDESAVAAVEKWQFMPARRGSTAVACTVRVPIIFTLNAAQD